MDMEHYQYQLLHFSPQDNFTMASPGFFSVGGSGGYSYSPHFQAGGIVDVDEPLAATAAGIIHDGGWVDPEELMRLGDEMFGGGGDAIAAAGMGDHETWQYDDYNGGSSEDHHPPPCVSPDGGDASPPSGEQAGAGPHDDEDGGGGDDASPAARGNKRRDRSKTIVSERKRRVRMKEKLYELRSLVPNITKMDKASIIADAVMYVRGLQAHARKLGEVVAALEARPTRSPAGGPRPNGEQQHGGRSGAPAGRRGAGHGARVTRVGAAEVGGGRFFVTVECERRDGVAAALCAAMESLACFRVESSSIVRSGHDRVVSTLTLKVHEQVGDVAIGEASVKLWVMAALLKEGFRHESTVEISSRSTFPPIN